jgi:hypothetical protein
MTEYSFVTNKNRGMCGDAAARYFGEFTGDESYKQGFLQSTPVGIKSLIETKAAGLPKESNTEIYRKYSQGLKSMADGIVNDIPNKYLKDFANVLNALGHRGLYNVDKQVESGTSPDAALVSTLKNSLGKIVQGSKEYTGIMSLGNAGLKSSIDKELDQIYDSMTPENMAKIGSDIHSTAIFSKIMIEHAKEIFETGKDNLEYGYKAIESGANSLVKKLTNTLGEGVERGVDFGKNLAKDAKNLGEGIGDRFGF